MRPFRLVSAVALVTLTAACGSKSPTAPAASTPTIAGLAILGTDAVLTGTAANYSVTATVTDGTSRTVTATWTSSNPTVATVSDAGVLEGRTHGSTTITATSGTQTVSRTIRVINDYTGTWDGRFIVNGCDAPPGYCAAMEVDVFSFPVRLIVSQGGADQSDINGTLILSSFSLHASVSGRVTADGRLNLAGTSDQRHGDNVWGTFHVDAWDTVLVDGGMMKGRWAQRVTTVNPIANEIMENELETMKRVSAIGSAR